MNAFVIFILVLLMLAVAGILVTGIVAMAKGGEFNRKYGNKLMQARVFCQGAALALIVLAFLFSHK